MKPLLMMRTRGLQGPSFGRHVGNRSSHPLANSKGNAFSIGRPVPASHVSMFDLANFMQNEGWDIINLTNDDFVINDTGNLVKLIQMDACDFSSFGGAVMHDLKEGVQNQGFCL